MSELRRDPIIGRWVIINTENPLLPEDYPKEEHIFHQRATCQFCPGRENQTPPEIECVRQPGSAPNTPGWQVRDVANKFPALRIEEQLDKRGVGIFDMVNGVGAHEVVIETPDHFKDMADFSEEELLAVIKVYKARYLGLAQDKRFRYILIFRNFGEEAGASIEHPHSQIIALPMVPKYVLEKINGAKNYFQYRGRSIFTDIIAQEYENEERIITDNESFLAFCPYVPRFSFEFWIIPKDVQENFFDMNEKQQKDLAAIMRNTLSRLKKVLGAPSYNFYIHTAPVNKGRHEGFYWHIEVIPSLGQVAGFEWGTGFYVVHTPPKMAAEYLRSAEV